MMVILIRHVYTVPEEIIL